MRHLTLLGNERGAATKVCTQALCSNKQHERQTSSSEKTKAKSRSTSNGVVGLWSTLNDCGHTTRIHWFRSSLMAPKACVAVQCARSLRHVPYSYSRERGQEDERGTGEVLDEIASRSSANHIEPCLTKIGRKRVWQPPVLLMLRFKASSLLQRAFPDGC